MRQCILRQIRSFEYTPGTAPAKTFTVWNILLRCILKRVPEIDKSAIDSGEAPNRTLHIELHDDWVDRFVGMLQKLKSGIPQKEWERPAEDFEG